MVHPMGRRCPECETPMQKTRGGSWACRYGCGIWHPARKAKAP